MTSPEINPTDSQKKAIHDLDHNLLVLSGPGTGKTSIISQKVAYMLEQGYQASEILITTYTTKATDELKSRVSHYCTTPLHHLEVHTIHGFCRKVIREFSYLLDPHTDFQLLDAIDQKIMLLQHHETLGLSRSFFSNDQRFHENIFKLFSFYDSLNENLIDLPNLKRYVSQSPEGSRSMNLAAEKGVFLNDHDMTEILDKYRRFMWDQRWLDYSQSLKTVYTLLKQYDEPRKVLQNRYKYILIDEYQDTSRLQHEIFRLLASGSTKICAVGDDDQGIYQFRGACVDHLSSFEKDFPDVKTLTIGENFRSTEGIVRLSKGLIESNGRRSDKDLVSMRGKGADVFLIEGSSRQESGEIICQAIKAMMESHVVTSYSDIAILFRSVKWGFIGGGYKKILMDHNIPCIIHKSGGLFDNEAVRYFTEFLDMITRDSEFESQRFYDILVRLNLSKETFNAFLEHSTIKMTLDILSPEHLKETYHSVDSIDFKKLSSIYQMVVKAKKDGKHEVLGTLYALFDLSDHFSMALNMGDSKTLSQIAYLTSLAQSYETWGGQSLRSFVDQILMFRDKRTLEEVLLEEEKDGVHVSTIHNVKGLEYKAVFVCDFDPVSRWNDDFRIPQQVMTQVAPSSDRQDNQNRLFYVALTRAKDFLFLCHSKTNRYGKPIRRNRFIEKALRDHTLKPYEPTFFQEPSSPFVSVNNTANHSISVSYTAIQSYTACPLKYQLENVYHFKCPETYHTRLGTVIHKVLENLHLSGRHSQKVSEEFIFQLFSRHLESQTFIRQDEESEAYNEGRKMLLNYFQNHYPPASVIHSVETDFEVFLGDHRFIGSIDLVLKNEDDSVEIIDFKTGKPVDSAEEQLLTYAMAYQMQFDRRVSAVKAHYLKDSKIVSYPITPEKLEQTKYRIIGTCEKIGQKHFSPYSKRESCFHCSFKICCTFAIH